jgi:hypothetical protein
VRLKRGHRPVRVRNEPEPQPARREQSQRVLDVVVEEEVVRRCPLYVDLPRAGVERGPCAAHFLDDAARVTHEDGVFVDVLLMFVQQRRGRPHRVSEPVLVDRDPVPFAESAIPDTLKRGARVDEREVHVEEHGRHRERSGVTSPPVLHVGEPS